LEDICSENEVTGTNTSTIPITEIATAVKFPERVVGIHFFNPVHRMKLVEIIRGLSTSDETVSSAKDFVLSIGKKQEQNQRDGLPGSPPDARQGNCKRRGY
jgi:3-hydroxybutyryl-CoA dehydrogenase